MIASKFTHIRWLWAVGLLTFVGSFSVSCGGPRTEHAASPGVEVHTGAAAISAALADGRRARSEAEAIQPPAVPPNLDRQSASEFLRGPLLTWVKARTARSEAAAFAYGAVIAEDDPDELTGLLELGALWQSFGDELQNAVIASVPDEFALREQKHTYLAALLEGTRRPFDEAYGALHRCVARAEVTGHAEAAAACKERLARLPELVRSTRPAAVAAEYPTDSAAKHAAPARPKISGSEPSPCVFAGSLSTEFALWSDPRTHTRLARVWRLDLASLVLPEKEGDPARLSAVWPVQGNYWLDAAALPLTLRERQDLVKEHVWLDAGTPVQAYAAQDGTAQIMRPRKWTTGSKPTFSRRMSCSELGLSGSIQRPTLAEKSYISFAGQLELSAAPGTPMIAELQLGKPTAFVALSKRGPWHRIQAQAADWELPFSFDAWTKNVPTEDAGLGMIGLLNESSSSHVSTQALQVFVAPSVTAASLTLAPEVWFQAGLPKAGFVPIRVDGLLAPEPAKELWIRNSDLSQRARSLP